MPINVDQEGGERKTANLVKMEKGIEGRSNKE